MQTTEEPGRTFATRILAELQALRVHLSDLSEQIATMQEDQAATHEAARKARQDLDKLTLQAGILTDCATTLLGPQEGTDRSPLQAMMHLMQSVVSGTEATQKSLEVLNANLFDSRLNSALRAAILDS